MKTIYSLASTLIFMAVFAQDSHMKTRAPRPDASNAGPTQQLVSQECALLAQIKQCVCNIDNQLQGCCSVLDMEINELASAIDGDLEQIITILQDISGLDTFISSFEILFSLVESINISLIETLIVTIEGLDSSFDHVSSLIDYDIAIDQTTLSKVSKIETQTETVLSLLDILVNQNCASDNDLIISSLDAITSVIDAANTQATQALAVDQTVASLVETIDTQLDTVQSLIDFAMIDCSSRSDIILERVQLLQEQEASCCAELFSEIDALQDDINSRLDVIEGELVQVSNVEELISHLSVLISVIDTFDSALFTSLIDTTESGFDVVTSQLDVLSGCGATPISAPTTITLPGNYCLDQDITGNITIASSDVTLNLNERIVSGSIIVTGVVSNIEIINGFVDAGTSNNAIDIFGDITKISLSYLYVRGFYGVLISQPSPSSITHHIDIDYVTAYNCQESGFLLEECYGNVSNSAAYSGNNFGFAIYNSLDSESITIENCEAFYNINVGFACTNQLTTALPNYNILNCTAYSNGARGFSLGKNINAYISHCFASNNGAINTNAKDGFFIENTSVTDRVAGIISDCVSTQNASAGFNLARLDASGPRFTGNYATDNGIIGSTIANYAVGSAVVNKNTPPYYWLSWKNSGAGRRVNVNGNDIT